MFNTAVNESVGEWYLGVYCRKCRAPVPVFQDHGRGVAVAGGTGKLTVACPRCGKKARYAAQEVISFLVYADRDGVLTSERAPVNDDQPVAGTPAMAEPDGLPVLELQPDPTLDVAPDAADEDAPDEGPSEPALELEPATTDEIAPLAPPARAPAAEPEPEAALELQPDPLLELEPDETLEPEPEDVLPLETVAPADVLGEPADADRPASAIDADTTSAVEPPPAPVSEDRAEPADPLLELAAIFEEKAEPTTPEVAVGVAPTEDIVPAPAAQDEPAPVGVAESEPAVAAELEPAIDAAADIEPVADLPPEMAVDVAVEMTADVEVEPAPAGADPGLELSPIMEDDAAAETAGALAPDAAAEAEPAPVAEAAGEPPAEAGPADKLDVKPVETAPALELSSFLEDEAQPDVVDALADEAPAGALAAEPQPLEPSPAIAPVALPVGESLPAAVAPEAVEDAAPSIAKLLLNPAPAEEPRAFDLILSQVLSEPPADETPVEDESPAAAETSAGEPAPSEMPPSEAPRSEAPVSEPIAREPAVAEAVAAEPTPVVIAAAIDAAPPPANIEPQPDIELPPANEPVTEPQPAAEPVEPALPPVVEAAPPPVAAAPEPRVAPSAPVPLPVRPAAEPKPIARVYRERWAVAANRPHVIAELRPILHALNSRADATGYDVLARVAELFLDYLDVPAERQSAAAVEQYINAVFALAVRGPARGGDPIGEAMAASLRAINRHAGLYTAA